MECKYAAEKQALKTFSRFALLTVITSLLNACCYQEIQPDIDSFNATAVQLDNQANKIQACLNKQTSSPY